MIVKDASFQRVIKGLGGGGICPEFRRFAARHKLFDV